MPDKPKQIWFRYRGKLPFVYPWPVHWKGLALQILPLVALLAAIYFAPFDQIGFAIVALIAVWSVAYWILFVRHSEPDND